MTSIAEATPPLPPGPKGRRLRNLRRRTSSFFEFLEELHKEYGDIVAFDIPFMKCCAVFDEELIQEVHIGQETHFRPFMPGDDENEFFKFGFVNMHQGDEHRRRRRLMDSAFTDDRMDTYAPILLEEAEALRRRCVPGRVIDIRAEMERFVWDTLVRVIVGRDTRFERGLGKDMLAAGKLGVLLNTLPLPLKRLIERFSPVTKRGMRANAMIDDEIYAAIRRAGDPSHDGVDMISHFVRATDRGIVDWTFDNDRALHDEALATLGLYIDSPTAALTYGIHNIARYQGVRERLEQEIDDVLGDRQVTRDDLAHLPYLQAVFSETLRLDPPPYAGLAKQALEDCVVGGYLVAKGTLVHPGFGVLHRKEEHWDHPREFRPERWLENSRPNGRRCPEHGFMPFGNGPHTCPAGDFATVMFAFAIATLVRRLRLEPKSTRPPRKENLGVGVRGPYRIIVSERRSAAA